MLHNPYIFTSDFTGEQEYKKLWISNSRNFLQNSCAEKNVHVLLDFLQKCWRRKNEEPQYKSVESPQRVPPPMWLKHSVQEWCVPGSSDKGDAAACLVDLPHVQLLVLLQGLLELGGGKATRDAALLRFGHANHPTGSTAARHALCGELTHQRKDDVGRALSPERKESKVDLRFLDLGRRLVWL